MTLRAAEPPPAPDRRITPDRRGTVAIPAEWSEARTYLEGFLGEVLEDVHAIRKLLERNVFRVAIMWAVACTVATLLAAGVVTLVGRHIDRSFAAAAVTAQTVQDERIEAIADALGDIPAGLRTSSGAPRVDALQAHLPGVRGISMAERDAACLRVPMECVKP